MLVRAVRSRQRGRSIRVVALVAVAISVVRPQQMLGQQPAIPKTHVVKRGDTLWGIAKLYLGDPFLWPEIYRLNTDIIEDPHWIYPGESLKLPGETTKVIAAAPSAAPTPTAVNQPTVAAPKVTAPSPAPVDTAPAPLLQEARSLVRAGEYAAAPWVDKKGGPSGSGYVMQNAALPGIASADQSRVDLYDRVVFAPPAGAATDEHQLYLAYRLGPVLDPLGQVVIPTGIIQMTRSPRDGEAALGRVVKMFGEMGQGQRLIPYDSNAAMVAGHPTPVANGRAGKVRWIFGNPVLPRLQNYIVLDMSKNDGLSTGDQIELFEPRKGAGEGRPLAIPEVSIAHAQVLRVTSYGATAIVTAQEQPKIQEGTAARVAAKMP
ncbi:MAG TPA: LysM peptidoglycan-binding domain-containing protein [Gemmatimonadaceae bacterium]|jgi:LysM repeat protein|nr:LysM peptidoglycan-binding domain-containing protein [Gemmatimonadaceae bacterium]